VAMTRHGRGFMCSLCVSRKSDAETYVADLCCVGSSQEK